ncbi:cation diffusion facilitator family transporter [Candidatus Parcubacteria bacterium]|nr:cation diffusion facilitator family transporter [Candidatus Parcubacteria bacterium]
MNKESVSIFSILANIFLGISKLVIGLMINSAALVADGIHSATDFVSSLGVFIGIKIAKKPADKEHPYGHYAAETLSGLGVVLLLILAGIWIMYDGVGSILNKNIIQLSSIGIIVVVFSIFLNEAMARLKLRYGRKENSLALIADAEHSRADAISSVGVLIGLLIASLGSGYFLYADGLIAIFIGMYILKESYKLGREVVDNLLGVRDEKTEEMIKEYCKQKNISLIGLKTRKIGPVISAEITIKLDARLKVEEAEGVSKKLQNDLLAKIKNLKYVVIQVESHKTRQGFIRQRWGRRIDFRERFKPLGPEKKGYRIVIPFKDGKFYSDFGAPEYLVVDREGGRASRILEKQIVENPFFAEGIGGGMRFIKSLNPDEVITQKIGPGATERLKELGIKLTIIKDENEIKEFLP